MAEQEMKKDYIVKLADLPERLDSLDLILDKIVEGDCLDLMRRMPDKCVDAVITDPPYGFNRASWDGKDFKESLSPRLVEVSRLLAGGGWLFLFSGTGECLSVGNLVPLDFRRMLWMYKPADCTYPWQGWLLKSEAILAFSKGAPSALRERNPYRHDCYIHTRVGMEGVDGHPSVKPLAVITDLVSRITGLIFDPFLGSGTTAVAAKKLGRHFIGCEISPGYCKIAERRLQEIDAQPSLFEDKTKPEQLLIVTESS